MTEEKWEVLEEVAGDFQAQILSGLLESQGIQTVLSQEGAGRVYGLTVGEFGKVQILVPSRLYEQARQVLDDY